MSNISENPILNNIDQTVSPIERKYDESNTGSPFILPSILLTHQTDESYPFDNAISITRTLNNLECSLKDQDVEDTELFVKKTHNVKSETNIFLRKKSLAINDLLVPESSENDQENNNIKNYPIFKRKNSDSISIKDIEQEGLKLLLHSAVPLGYFLYYLLTEYSSENLFFYLAVDNYQNYPFSSQKERRIIANKITKAYLTSSSELEVNLEEHVHMSVKKALEQQRSTSISSGNEFEAAKRHVFPLLNNSYYRFQTSPVWTMMESKCNDIDSYSAERSQALVVNLLLSCMERGKNKYCKAISKLLCSFCHVYLPIGYQLLNSTGRFLNEKTKKGEGDKKIRIKSDLLETSFL